MKSLLLGLALATACGSKSAPLRTTPTADDPSCPLLVPGTSLSVEDTSGGAALVFVTTGDPLAVRARAARLAEMHTNRDGSSNQLGMIFSAGSTAIATEIEGGARVELTAAAADGAAALQKELRMHASHLRGDRCDM